MTVNLYYSTSSKSSRSARAWLVDNNIPFNERDIIANPLDRDELKQILRLTENGFEDIVSTRSKAFKALHIDLSDLGFNQLLDLLVEKPQLLKRPIIYDGRRLQIGYNEEDIRAFLPRSVRKSELREIQQKLYDDDQQAVG